MLVGGGQREGVSSGIKDAAAPAEPSLKSGDEMARSSATLFDSLNAESKLSPGNDRLPDFIAASKKTELVGQNVVLADKERT